MANTVTKNGRFVTLSALDSNFIFTTNAYADKPFIKSIEIVPTAKTNVVIIRDGATDGPIVMKLIVTDTLDGSMIKYFNEEFIPVLVIAECTVAAGTLVIMHLGGGKRTPIS